MADTALFPLGDDAFQIQFANSVKKSTAVALDVIDIEDQRFLAAQQFPEAVFSFR